MGDGGGVRDIYVFADAMRSTRMATDGAGKVVKRAARMREILTWVEVGGDYRIGGILPWWMPFIPPALALGGSPDPEPEAPKRCGDTLLVPQDTTMINVASMLLGEDSWAYIGQKSYSIENTDTPGNPTGPVITEATVMGEMAAMISTVITIAQQNGRSLN